MKFTHRHLIILLIQITEVLGWSIILPFLPLMAEAYGANALMVGMIMTTFSSLQFFSSPIMGRLSDAFGRRPLLMLAQLSSMLGFIVLGFANTLPLIFLSRAIDGALGSNFTIAQAYLSDISSKKDRSASFAISGIAFGIGFLIGPAVGGYLATINYSLPAFLAAGLTLLTIVLTYFLLPETVTLKKNVKFKVTVEMLGFSHFGKYLKNKILANRLLQLFLYLLGHMVVSTMFTLFASKKWGFGVDQIGLILAFVGLVSIVVRSSVIPVMVKLMDEYVLKLIGVVLMGVGLFALIFVPNIWWVYGLMGVFSFGNGLVRPLMMGSISRWAKNSEQGAVLGLANSLGSVAQIIAPLLGGFVLMEWGADAVVYISVVLMVVCLGVVLKRK